MALTIVIVSLVGALAAGLAVAPIPGLSWAKIDTEMSGKELTMEYSLWNMCESAKGSTRRCLPFPNQSPPSGDDPFDFQSYRKGSIAGSIASVILMTLASVSAGCNSKCATVLLTLFGSFAATGGWLAFLLWFTLAGPPSSFSAPFSFGPALFMMCGTAFCGFLASCMSCCCVQFGRPAVTIAYMPMQTSPADSYGPPTRTVQMRQP